MLVAAGVGLASALLAAGAQTLPMLAAATVLTGMTGSVFLLARQGFMIDAVPSALRARALSTLGGTHRIGIFLGPLPAAPIIASYGVRSAFLFSAAMSLLAFALVLSVPDLGADARDEAREDPASVLDVLGTHPAYAPQAGPGRERDLGAARHTAERVAPVGRPHRPAGGAGLAARRPRGARRDRDLLSGRVGVGGMLAAGWLWRWVGPVDRRRRADERMPA